MGLVDDAKNWWKVKKEKIKNAVRNGSGTNEIIELMEVLMASVAEIDEQNIKLQESIERLEKVTQELYKASKITFWIGIISLLLALIALIFSIILIL